MSTLKSTEAEIREYLKQCQLTLDVYNDARVVIQNGMLQDAARHGCNFNDGTWFTQAPSTWKRETGQIIQVVLPVMRGDPAAPKSTSYRWMRGAGGAVALFKISPALLLCYFGRNLEIKPITTRSHTDPKDLRDGNYIESRVNGVDDSKELTPGCAGIVRIEKLEDRFQWSDEPRFVHRSESLLIPNGAKRQELGCLSDPADFVLIASYHKTSRDPCSDHILSVVKVIQNQKIGNMNSNTLVSRFSRSSLLP